MKLQFVIPSLVLASALSSSAAVVFSDDFSGANASFLHGSSPDVNTLGTNPTATWSSTIIGDTTLRADGAANSIATNVDRGAWLDLGTGFLATGSTYTLTLNYSNLTNGVLFFGLSDLASPNLDIRAQNQGALGVGLRVRNITGGIHVSSYSNVAGVETGSVIATGVTPGSTGAYTLTIQTNNLTDATATIGDAVVNFNATNLNKVFIAFEDNGTSSGTFDSVVIEQIPEPSVALLGGLGVLALLRRRR